MEHPAETATHGQVRLRRWQDCDDHLLHRLVTESSPHLRPWMAWATDDYDLTSAREFLAQCNKDWACGRAFAYAVTTGDVVVGGCGLARRIGPGGLEIGYWLHPAHTGRGLATDATAALIDQAFRMPDVRRLQIRHDAANTASEAIPRRLGFSEIERCFARDPVTPGDTGIDVIWQLTRSSQ